MVLFVLLLSTMFFALFILIITSESIENMRRKKYKAYERFGAYHMGGLPGLPRMKRLQLFMNEHVLTIKPWRQPALMIPVRNIAEVRLLGAKSLNRDKIDNLYTWRCHFGEMPLGSDLDPIRQWTRFRRPKWYVLLHYVWEDEMRAVCFGFGNGQADEREQQPFYQCYEVLERHAADYRRRDPKDAVGTVSLRKRIVQTAGKSVWRKDPESNGMTSRWES
ncbi:hypothetical protein [Saccharibacillus kuerlensis]|uniref:Uncharacterized protein n=1 Tax=Saccharibacillus kuerlensis TaxID=459527 RepID=A0ABQ2KYQ2_9BACL|nr:hypothetical protein [Saccharibacillus kuerlensis]GGN94673.1 hypothetical protein GCM10010969_09570 [Saccharibacillus kuerlensis]